MNPQIENITSPVGRLVQGDLYTPSDKDMHGALRTVKTGANIGKANPIYYFALAIPKTPGKAWWDEPWGATILQVGATGHPQAYQRPDFAWKITDGDSTVPNKVNKMPKDSPGFAGHWVIRFSSSFASSIYTLVGLPPGSKPAPVMEANAVVPGFWVQVNFNVSSNGQPNNPGVYLNPSMVCLIAYAEKIVSGPNPDQAGFGAAGALPPGASLVPPGGFTPPAGVAGPGMVAPPASTMVAPPPGSPYTPGAAPQPAPVAVTPHPGILAPAVAPPPPAAPPAAPVRVMTAKAQGAPYESFLAQGWTDALLIQHGYMNPL